MNINSSIQNLPIRNYANNNNQHKIENKSQKVVNEISRNKINKNPSKPNPLSEFIASISRQYEARGGKTVNKSVKQAISNYRKAYNMNQDFNNVAKIIDLSIPYNNK